MKLIKVLLIFVSLLCFFSCTKKKDVNIVLPTSFSVSILEEWAVVTELYTAYYEKPEIDSMIASHARLGDVLLIKGKHIDNEKRLWYNFENGWILENYVSVHSNELRALTASSELK